MPPVAAFFNIGPTEWVVILVIALLLFGRRLPEVMRNLGKGIVEFKKGVKGIEDEVDRPLPPPAQGAYQPGQYAQPQYGQGQGYNPYGQPSSPYNPGSPAQPQAPAYGGPYGQQAAAPGAYPAGQDPSQQYAQYGQYNYGAPPQAPAAPPPGAPTAPANPAPPEKPAD